MKAPLLETTYRYPAGPRASILRHSRTGRHRVAGPSIWHSHNHPAVPQSRVEFHQVIPSRALFPLFQRGCERRQS